jgi:hypothetical protein
LILAIGGGMMLAIIRGLVANGTLLIRVGTVELPSTGAAHFEMVIIEGASHLVVTGHDPGSNAYRGLAQMTQRGPYCHVEVDRILHSVRQYSGDYIHAFRASEPCTTVTFGKRRVAVAPGQRPPSRSPALLSEG